MPHLSHRFRASTQPPLSKHSHTTGLRTPTLPDFVLFACCRSDSVPKANFGLQVSAMSYKRSRQ